MTYTSKLLRFFIATMMLAAFALPASAAQPTKMYSLDITPYNNPSPGDGTPVSLPASGGRVNWTIKNETATGGNAAISSFKIKQKLAGVVISDPQGATFAVDPATGDLLVNGFSPLLPKDQQGAHSVTINFYLKAADPCTAANIQWDQLSPLLVTVHTGNFSNTTFQYLEVAGLNQTTNLSAGTCVNVTGAVSPAGAGTVVCNPAKILVNTGSSTCTATANSGYFLTSFSNNCSYNVGTNTCTVSNVTTDTTVTGYFALSNGKVGCISGNVPNTGSTNNYDSSLGKQDFTYDPDKSNVPFNDGWGLRRGNNKDDAPCVLVDYAFTPAASGNGYVASLLFDQTSGQKASWKYLIVWPTAVAAALTDPNKGWTTWRPSVSWGIANPTPNTTDFVPALFCVDDVADVDITTLTGAQLAARLPVIPNDCPSGPFCTSPNAQYQPGQTAKVCIARHGVTTGPLNTLFPFTEVLDEADGYINPLN